MHRERTVHFSTDKLRKIIERVQVVASILSLIGLYALITLAVLPSEATA